MSKYYSITIPQYYLEKQCIEEMLRERTTHEIKEKNLKDFWLFPNSYFYSFSSFFDYKLSKSLGDKIFKLNLNNKYPIFYSIISTNLDFIVWLKIRMGSFLNLGNFKINNEKFIKTNENQKEEIFTSYVGFYSEFSSISLIPKGKINNFILKYHKNYLYN